MSGKFLAFAAAVTVLTAPAAAQAQGLADFGRLLLGLPTTETKEPIDYRERAPLVVPPTQNLRPPAPPTAPDQRRANWPQDPDVVARRKAAEDARRPASFDTVVGRDTEITRRMTLQEVRAGRIAGAEVPRVPSASISPDRSGVESQHNTLAGATMLRDMDRRDAANAQRDAELGRAEPRREFLTDPPSGVRRPADNAAFRASREGRVGVQEAPSPYDIFREGPRTR
jgi:hypothetical protein